MRIAGSAWLLQQLECGWCDYFSLVISDLCELAGLRNANCKTEGKESETNLRKSMKSFLLKVIATAMVGFTAVSCTTSYDAYGSPRQSVDPLAAAAVAGVAGYAIGHNNSRPKYYYGGPYNRPYYRNTWAGRGYVRPINPYRANAFRHRGYWR